MHTGDEPRLGTHRRGLRRVLRDQVVLVVSAVVVAAVGLQLLSPAEQRFRLRVTEHALIASDGASRPVVYGTVSDGSEPISGARVTLERTSRDPDTGERRADVVARTRTEEDGTFRLRGQEGLVTIRVRCICRDGSAHGSAQLRLRPDRAYQVEATLTSEHGFSVIPVSGY